MVIFPFITLIEVPLIFFSVTTTGVPFTESILLLLAFAVLPFIPDEELIDEEIKFSFSNNANAKLLFVAISPFIKYDIR